MDLIEDVDLLCVSGYRSRPAIRFRSDRTYTDHRGIDHKFMEGEVSDLHSVPWLARGIFPTIDEASIAAIIHDKQIIGLNYKDRKAADKDYRKNLRKFGSPFWVQWGKYAGVRIGSITHAVKNIFN